METKALSAVRMAEEYSYEKSINYIKQIYMTNISAFDLNLLRVLDALLSERSTVRAGKQIGLSQPAVSAALSRLRSAFDDELFFRQGQGLAPTSVALSLEEPVRDIMLGIEALLAKQSDFDPVTSKASFRVAGSDYFGELLMPQLLDRLVSSAPGMTVHLVDLVPHAHVETLAKNEIDLALVPQTNLPEWVDHETAFSSTFSVVVRRGHERLVRASIVAGDTIPLDLFCDLGHVLFSPEGRSAGMGDKALTEVGRTRRVAMSMNTFASVYRAVSNSDLVALIPTALAHHVADTANLEVFEPPMPIEPAEILVTWHRRFTSDPAHTWFRSQVLELLKPLDL